ncbi:MAG: hypothetical protein U1E59_16410 [Amaricoccus sp.]
MSINPNVAARPESSAGAIIKGLLRQAGARLVGPGGYYNAGNALGLTAGIAVAISALPEGGADLGGVFGATLSYLGGDPSALALTGATAIFFWSGECYHRAWANGFPPIEALNRRGDFLSGIGALILGIALLSLGQPVLAITSGLLHALGKFGSARHWHPVPGWQHDWPNFWRTLVLFSRVPAILATIFGLIDVLATRTAGTPASAWLMPLVFLGCYAFWCRADLMLFDWPARSADPARS